MRDLRWNVECPKTWTRISTVEMHTGGEPLRVITAGLPPVRGAGVLEKRRYFREHYDHLRTGLMFEPRERHVQRAGGTHRLDRDLDQWPSGPDCFPQRPLVCVSQR